MNCKQGDTAYVYRVTHSDYLWMIGQVVKCTRLEVMDGRAGWHLEQGITHNTTVFEWMWVADDCLRPIRDPGDDAQDETLEWLPVPSKEGVPA